MDNENNNLSRLLKSYIPGEENKALRQEFNVTEDLALKIVDLRKENERLREMLQPFKELAYEVIYNSNNKSGTVFATNKAEVTVEDLRAVSDYFMERIKP